MHSRRRAAPEGVFQETCKHTGTPLETPPVQAGNKIVRKPPQLTNENAKEKSLAYVKPSKSL